MKEERTGWRDWEVVTGIQDCMEKSQRPEQDKEMKVAVSSVSLSKMTIDLKGNLYGAVRFIEGSRFCKVPLQR